MPEKIQLQKDIEISAKLTTDFTLKVRSHNTAPDVNMIKETSKPMDSKKEVDTKNKE